ncbi:M20 family metallopeptidase [Chloroflexota bacterium]
MEVAELLQALVHIPSPNPPGDTRELAGFIAQWLAEVGGKVQTPAPATKPQAVNVVASIGQGTPVVMLHAHIDTVPIAADESGQWSVDPYAGVIKDGRLYGKGSVDDKAPLAAMMLVFRAAAQRQADLQGTLVLVGAAEEEIGGQLGTRWMADNGHLPEADFIVVGEQTHNQVATCHKGVVRATVRATGRSVHATNPDRGVNAITALAKAVLALDAYHQELSTRVHPLLGVPTCNVGVIEGGSTANAVPDSCVAYLDRRTIPGEVPAIVQRELRQVIEAVDAGAAKLQVGDFLVSNWFNSLGKSPAALLFMDCVQQVLRSNPGPIGYLPGSDAKHLVDLCREEMIIFGPGSYEVAHAFDEYVDLKELEQTQQILLNFINRHLLK